jgi:urease accessory protein
MFIESVLGNVSEPPWRQQVSDASVDHLRLDQWEAQKSRLRKRTAAGAEVAVSLHRGGRLRDGDVLAWDEPTRTATVVRIDLGEVMIVELAAVGTGDPGRLLRTCVEVGHAIGNQHWPAVVKGTRIYVPLTVDAKVMASVMRTHDFPGVSYNFAPGVEVIAFLAPHEARRLFGGAEATGHSHAPAVAG